jgi:hypothetical protein
MHRSSSASIGILAELRDRARYMERILKYEIKDVALDTESLRLRAEAIPCEGSDGDNTNPSSEELAIEDEICTISPVEGDTATRLQSL